MISSYVGDLHLNPPSKALHKRGEERLKEPEGVMHAAKWCFPDVIVPLHTRIHGSYASYTRSVHDEASQNMSTDRDSFIVSPIS